MIVVGGVVPPQDYEALKAAGAEAIFPPGTVIAEAAEELLDTLNRRLGHTQGRGGITSRSPPARRRLRRIELIHRPHRPPKYGPFVSASEQYIAKAGSRKKAST